MRAALKFGFSFLALTLFAGLPAALERAARPLAGVAANINGHFSEHGIAPASAPFTTKEEKEAALTDEFTPRDGLPDWSSWDPGGGAVGELVLGPFSAPAILGLRITGFPQVAGNRLELQNCVTGETLGLARTNVGFRWADVRVRVPASWLGKPVLIHAVDGSRGPYGWLGVGGLRAVPASAGWWTQSTQRAYAFLGAGGLFLLLLGTFLRLVRGIVGSGSSLLLLAGVAALALSAYATFWLMLASVAAGQAVVIALLLLSLVEWFWTGRKEPSLRVFVSAEVRVPVLLMVAIGFTYFGLLFLFQSDRPMHDVAARRYIRDLAMDNQVPEMLADHLIRGEDPTNVAYGWWFSSQRPPLESACDLVLAYPFSFTGIDLETAAQVTGIWLQLAWVAAAWAWLRVQGQSPRAAAVIIACLVPTGFLALNTVFIWPKLLAAAFIIGAFVILFLDAEVAGSRNRRYAVAGVFLSLGILSHSGIGFSVLAMVLMLLFRRPWPGVRPSLALIAVCACLLLPWSAYQHLYSPPGNFLTTTSLGGATSRDGRGVLATMITNYGKQPLATTLGVRAANLRMLFSGSWSQWVFTPAADLVSRRESEFRSTFFALGWWNLGWLAFLADAGRRIGRRERDLWRDGALISVLWCLASLAIFVAIMFFPGETKIHQGSYACMLTLYLCLAERLLRMNAGVFLVIALAGLGGFVLVWLPPVTREESTLSLVGLGFALAGVSGLVVTATRANAPDRARSLG
jgi:hypothetical protein